MGVLTTQLPMTVRSYQPFISAYEDGSMEALSHAIYRQFGQVLKECSDATNVNPLLGAILLYIEGKPLNRSEWKTNKFTGYSPETPSNVRFIGVGQIDVETAAYALFVEHKNSNLSAPELRLIQNGIGQAKTTQLYDLIKTAKKQPSPSDWLAANGKAIIYDSLFNSLIFNLTVSQIYFGQCLERHAGINSRYDKAFFAYNQGINIKFPLTKNTDALLVSEKQTNGKSLPSNGKVYILKSVGRHSPFWFLGNYFK